MSESYDLFTRTGWQNWLGRPSAWRLAIRDTQIHLTCLFIGHKYGERSPWCQRCFMVQRPVHIWRKPFADEPREEGGVCIKCGAYANAEGDRPCQPE